MSIVAIGAAATREVEGMKDVIRPKEEKKGKERIVRESRASQAPLAAGMLSVIHAARLLRSHICMSLVVDAGS